jgi:hypothetical protein
LFWACVICFFRSGSLAADPEGDQRTKAWRFIIAGPQQRFLIIGNPDDFIGDFIKE